MYHIIVNPIAGRGRIMERLALLTRPLDARGMAYTVYQTRWALDARDYAREVCLAGSRGIVGIGGDGTLQEVATGMADAFPEDKIPVPLGIFPAGSGNDFVMTQMGGKKRALAMYKAKQLPQAAEALADAMHRNRTRPVDVPLVNGTAYMNIGNLGLDARIVQNAIALKPRWGRYAYLAAVYKSIARHRNLPLVIKANGETFTGEYTLVAVCNGQYYGGGMHVAPTASITDGKFTLCLVEAMSRPKTMVIFPALMLAVHPRLRAVRFIACDEVRITLPAGEEILCLDGNLYPSTGELHFKVRPSTLELFQ